MIEILIFLWLSILLILPVVLNVFKKRHALPPPRMRRNESLILKIDPDVVNNKIYEFFRKRCH